LVRFAGFVAVTLALLPPYMAAPSLKRRIEALWFAAVLHLIGLRLTVHGRAAEQGPVLFAANHVSYLDIMVLGRLLDARFIAKEDVRSWPGIGVLARVSGTCFIRRAASQAAAQAGELAARLERGQSLILFAEGTSSDGAQVLPFKSSLFGVAERVGGLTVQPVAIRYSRLNGAPIADGAARDGVAWYGEMTLMPHLWAFLGQRSCEVEVCFLEPMAGLPENGRKALAKAAEHSVRDVLQTP